MLIFAVDKGTFCLVFAFFSQIATIRMYCFTAIWNVAMQLFEYSILTEISK